MAIRLFSLSDASTKEANDLIEALNNAKIKYYLTPEAQWAGGTSAIWLIHEKDLEAAKNILSTHHKKYHAKNNIYVPRWQIWRRVAFYFLPIFIGFSIAYYLSG